MNSSVLTRQTTRTSKAALLRRSTFATGVSSIMCKREVMKLQEIKLASKAESQEAKDAVGFKYNDEAGFGHEIGGHPDFVQGKDDWSKCCDSA